MRFIQAFVFLAFLAAIGVFAAQNTGVITVNFLNWSLSQPMALLTVAVYFLGMLSGWTVLAFMKRSFRQATQHPAQ
jgi:putative membrane protein